MTVKVALVAAQEARFKGDIVLFNGHSFRRSSQLNRVEAKTSFIVADGAVRLTILVLAALIAKFKVKGEDELFVRV